MGARRFACISALFIACASERPPKSATAEGAPAGDTQEEDRRAAEAPTEPSTTAARADESGATGGDGAAGAKDEDGVEAMLAELDEEEEAGIREVPGCNTLRGKDDCVGVGKVMLGCIGLGNVLGPEPTRALVACLGRLNGSEALCDAAALETCGLSAIDAVPPTTASRAACREIFDRCGEPKVYADRFTEARCAKGLAAARKRVGDGFVGCMRERCDLRLCLSGVL